MATNRIETLDPALIRPGRIDRKIEFPLPDEKTKRRIFNIHTSRMTLADDVNLDDLIQVKDDLSGADIKAICTEAGLLALRERRMKVTNEDFKKSKENVLYRKSEGTPEGLYLWCFHKLLLLQIIMWSFLIMTFEVHWSVAARRIRKTFVHVIFNLSWKWAIGWFIVYTRVGKISHSEFPRNKDDSLSSKFPVFGTVNLSGNQWNLTKFLLPNFEFGNLMSVKTIWFSWGMNGKMNLYKLFSKEQRSMGPQNLYLDSY